LLITIALDLFGAQIPAGIVKVLWVIFPILIILPCTAVITQGRGWRNAETARVHDEIRRIVGFSRAGEFDKLTNAKRERYL